MTTPEDLVKFQATAKDFLETLEIMPVTMQDALRLKIDEEDYFYYPWLFRVFAPNIAQELEIYDLGGEAIRIEWIEVLNKHYSILSKQISNLIHWYKESNEFSIEFVARRVEDHFGEFCGSLTTDWKSLLKKCEDSLVSNSTHKRKPSIQPEKQLEQELFLWLLSNKIPVERQVSTNRHRFDLWIPGKCFLELKAAKVSGDDICQALDYYATYKRQVVIIGKSLSNGASRGIEAISKLHGDDAVVFITWGAAKNYLSSVLGF